VDDPSQAELLGFFKALGDASRLKLIGLVAQREHNVRELAERVGLTEPTVSHHLSLLKKVGLVRQRGDGTTHWYVLDPDVLPRLAKRLLSPEEIAGLAGPEAAESDEEAVMNAFVTAGGTLTKIPASRKKRWIILAWLARQFDEGRSYAEKEVNEKLRARHPDFATIRREFIGYRMMARDAGIYRRLPESDWVREVAVA